jgi:uncharacterized protein (TIGR03545 family)
MTDETNKPNANSQVNAPSGQQSSQPIKGKNPSKKKTTRRKGPIRTEAVVPFLIFVGVVWAYFFFFFDTHVRHALEHFGTNANGAEVNIARVHTSFWNASLEINNVQVTNAKEPAKNTLQIGAIRWKMLWDALLRGKIAIDEASIQEIQLGVPRKKPGRVLPPEPPPPPGTESKFAELKREALQNVEQEFSKNVLGDAASLLGGTDSSTVLKGIEGQLKSTARVKQLQEDLGKKQKEWQTKIDQLPQAKELQALNDRLRKVKLNNFNSPQEVQASLQELDSIFKEADAKYKLISSTAQALNSDLTLYQNSLKELDDLVKQDIKLLESRLKLPALDMTSLSQALFGPMFIKKVKQAEFYYGKAREYMPPKKTAAEKAEFAKPKPHERAKGRTYKFGRPNSYPLFWLKKAEISSKANPQAEYAGDLVGTIRDLTDDPPTLGRPTVATFKGDFPTQKIFGVNGELLLDHTTENAIDKFEVHVARYAIDGQKLVDSDDVKLGFESAQGASHFLAELRGGEINVATKSQFTGINYLVNAKQPVLAEVLSGAVKDVPTVTLDAAVTGPWTSLSFKIDSNLGRELAKALDKQLQAKINEARAKVQALVDERVGKEKAKLQAEFAKIQDQVNKVIKSKEDELNKQKAQVEQAKNQAANDQKKKLENEGQKALDELKKKFKF